MLVGILYPSFGIKLSPMIGAACMSLSSVCVVANALRLRKFKSNKSYDLKENQKIEDENMQYSSNGLKKKIEGEMIMKTVFIEGMMCENCKKHVEKALKSIEGVTNVEVYLEEKKAVIESTCEIDDEKIKEVIKEAGYKVSF